MAVQFVPYTARETGGARAFNERMRRGGARSEFLLPDDPPSPSPCDAAIRAAYLLAVEDGLVRGGFVLADYPAWLGGAEITGTDCMAPLSEGIIDSKYSLLAMQFTKYLRQRTPYAFAVGMGAAENPYPRLLRASGWTLLAAPFLFRVCRPARFFRELRLLRLNSLRRMAGHIAAATGLGAVAVTAMHAGSWTVRSAAARMTLECPAGWGEWADEIWDNFKTSCSFAVRRDSHTLRFLYPTADPNLVRLLVRREGRAVAWAAALNTQMRGDKYFGDMRVATILDCLGEEPHLAAAVLKVTGALAREGADLVITNQTHTRTKAAFLGAGFRRGPTNYHVGISKAIAESVRSGLGEGAIHITRGDGDGRMHL